MQFSFKKVIGETEFTIIETADNTKELIKKVAFFSSLPSVGPGGETDLVLTHRTTKEGHEYYSIVSQKAKKEFNLGQNKDMISLFAKGWDDLFIPENNVQNTNVGPQGLGQAQQYAPAPAQQLQPQANQQTLQNQPPQNQPPQNQPVAQPAYADVLNKYNLG